MKVTTKKKQILLSHECHYGKVFLSGRTNRCAANVANMAHLDFAREASEVRAGIFSPLLYAWYSAVLKCIELSLEIFQNH